MCSLYGLNKQGDSRQPCHTPFSILSQSIVLYRVLTIASWSAYRFLRRQVRQSGIHICLRPFHSLLWSTQLNKGFEVVDETEVDIFLELPSFLYEPANFGNLVSDSSSFSKPSLDTWEYRMGIYIWKAQTVSLRPNKESSYPGDSVFLEIEKEESWKQRGKSYWHSTLKKFYYVSVLLFSTIQETQLLAIVFLSKEYVRHTSFWSLEIKNLYLAILLLYLNDCKLSV